MWQAHHAPVQLSFFGEDYTRERIDTQAIIAEAHRLRAHAMAQQIRETGEWLGRVIGPVFTTEIKPVPADYHDMTARIHAMQAKATADMIHGAVLAIASFVGKWVGTPLLALRQRSVLVNELNRLDDRMLADIGLVRGDIAGIASKAFPLLPTADRIHGAASAIASFVGKWVGTPLLSLKRRSVLVNELSRLDDRMLADIGLVRGEITGIAGKAFPLLPAAASPAPTPATVHALPVTEKPALPAAAANESAAPLAA